MVIFLSNFLALLIKVDAAGEEEDRNTLGGIMVGVNILLVLAVLWTSWLSTQQLADDSRDEDTIGAIAKTMMAARRLAVGDSLLRREVAASTSPKSIVSKIECPSQSPPI